MPWVGATVANRYMLTKDKRDYYYTACVAMPKLTTPGSMPPQGLSLLDYKPIHSCSMILTSTTMHEVQAPCPWHGLSLCTNMCSNVHTPASLQAFCQQASFLSVTEHTCALCTVYMYAYMWWSNKGRDRVPNRGLLDSLLVCTQNRAWYPHNPHTPVQPCC